MANENSLIPVSSDSDKLEELDLNEVRKTFKNRPSNLLRQGAAAFADIPGGFAALPDLADILSETIFKTTTGAIGDRSVKDIGSRFVDNFTQTMNRPNVSPLGAISFALGLKDDPTGRLGLEAAMKVREKTNEALEIEEPETTAEQFARFGLFIPTKAATGPTAFLTPFIKRTTALPTAGRVGAQSGLSLGLETVARSVEDDPKRPPIVDLFPSSDELNVEQVRKDFDLIQGGESDDTLGGGEQLDELLPGSGQTVTPLPDVELPTDDDLLRVTDRAFDKAIDDDRLKKAGIIAAITAVGAVLGLGYRSARKARAEKALEPGGIAPFGAKEAEPTIVEKGLFGPDRKQAFSEMATRFAGNVVDESIHIRDALKKQGDASPYEIENIVGQGEAAKNSAGITENVFKFGEFGQGTGLTLRTTPQDLELMRLSMVGKIDEATGIDRAQLIAQDITALSEQGIRVRATINKFAEKGDAEFQAVRERGNLTEMYDLVTRRVPGGMRALERVGLKSAEGGEAGEFVSNDRLIEAENRLAADPEFAAFKTAYSDITDAAAEFMAKRNVFTTEQMQKFRDQVSYKGVPFFVPGREAKGVRGFYSDMSKLFGGKFTPKGQEMFDMNEMGLRGLTPGTGVIHPRDPMNSLHEYYHHIIDYVNRNNAELNFFKKTRAEDSIIDAADSGAIRFVGTSNPDNLLQPGRAKIEWNERDPSVKKLMRLGDKSLPITMEQAHRPEVMWVRENGVFKGYYVPDEQLRNALRFQPLFASTFAVKSANWSRKAFEFSITGRGSLFGPVAHLYNTELQAINRTMIAAAGRNLAQATKNVLLEPVLTQVDGLKGAWAVFSDRMATDISQIIAARIAISTEDTGPMMAKLQEHLQERIKNSLVAVLRREGGRFSAGFASDPVEKSSLDFVKSFAPAIRRAYGDSAFTQTAAALGRVWLYLNDAAREGASVGFAGRRLIHLRELGLDEPRAARQASKEAKDVTGDARRIGSGRFSKEFMVPSMPWWVPTVQGVATIVRSARKAATGRGVVAGTAAVSAAIASAIGLPTITDVVYNNLLPGEFPDPANPDKLWTYRDYYWNGLTTEQRINNIIIGAPGLPPWEAQLIPVEPQWAMARAVILEGLDAIVGFSKLPMQPSELDNGHHFIAALARLTQMPLPPVLKAVMTGLGANVEVHLGAGDDDSALRIFSPVSARPIGGTGMVGSGRTKDVVNRVFDDQVVQIAQDLFGNAARVMVNMTESFHAGMFEGLGTASEFAVEEGVQEIKRQARYAQPLLGKALHPRLVNEASNLVRNKINELRKLIVDATKLRTGGAAAGVEGATLSGNAIVPSVDPVIGMLAQEAQIFMDTEIKPHQDVINYLRDQITTLQFSSRDTVENRVLSRQEVRDRIDGWTNEIKAQRSLQLLALQRYEIEVSDVMSERLGREVNIKLERLSDFLPALTMQPSGLPALVDRRRSNLDVSVQRERLGPATGR